MVGPTRVLRRVTARTQIVSQGRKVPVSLMLITSSAGLPADPTVTVGSAANWASKVRPY